MAVTTENNRTDELITDGVVEEFDFSMLIFDKSEVEVYYKPDDGRYNSLLLDTNYGVTFTEDGGTVSTNGYSAPLAAGKLLIIRHLELTQQTNWLYNDNHTEQTHQDDFDRAVMRDLQIQGELNRCPKFPIHSSTKDITFPEPQVGYLIGWNSAGDNLTNISPPAAAGAITAILNDLDDVIIAAPINGDLLRYNGTEWTNDLAGAVTYTSITIAGNTLDTNEWSNLDGVDQSLASGDAVVFDDITISTPVNIYALSHDLFADYVAAEHINWTADQGATNIDAANLAGSPTFTEITIFGNTNLYRLYLAAEFESPDSVKEMLRLTRTEDDIALDGLGLSQEYYLEDAGGVTRHAARMIVDWTDIDSRISSIKFYTREGDSVDLRMTISDEIVIPGGVNVTGRIVANSYISGDSLITGGDVGIVADADLLQLAANALTVNGTLGAGAITGTSFIIGDNTLDTNEWAFLDGLDQSVKSGTAPTFTADNFSDGGSNAIITTTQETNWDNHIADNSQAHSDYLINNGDDSTSGVLTAAGFITAGNITLNSDSNKLLIGDGQDLEIYHDGTNSYIDNVGAGHLYIRNLQVEKNIFIHGSPGGDDEGGGGWSLFGGDGGDKTIGGTGLEGGCCGAYSGTGGDSDIAGGVPNIGGKGGKLTLRAGTGGAATSGTSNTSGEGGPVSFSGGIGGTGSAGIAGGIGGEMLLRGGGGGSNAPGETGGSGGDTVIKGGPGGIVVPVGTDGDGGDVLIDGGIGDTAGNIIMGTLPVGDPGVAGALWNDSGTMKVSAG